MLCSLRRFNKSEVAELRMKIIKFYDKYGENATLEAFGASRKVISRWRKRLKQGGGHLSSLIPYSTRPNRVRHSLVSSDIVTFIRDMIERYPRIEKEKIKPLLDKYCAKNSLKPISESTIGNIIKRHKFFYQKTGRIYHDPNSKWPQSSVKKQKRLRIRHPIKPKELGHIVSDLLERVTDGVKDYFYNAIDAKLKFALTLNYKRLNRRNMKDFYRRFKEVYLLTVKSWQSDNGKEHLGEFEEELKREGIPHYFSYPRCPKKNTYIERYNRTIQEEFIDNHLDIIYDKPLFHKRLAEYLILYNIERPYKSLGLKSPMDYLIENACLRADTHRQAHRQGGMSQTYVTYTKS